MKIFNSKKWLEKLGQFLNKETLDGEHNGLSSGMNLMDEEEFHQEILVTPIFNVRGFFPYISPLCIFCHGIGHVIRNYPYKASQILATNSMPNFVPSSFSNNYTTYINS
jgi:hypothetical protein